MDFHGACAALLQELENQIKLALPHHFIDVNDERRHHPLRATRNSSHSAVPFAGLIYRKKTSGVTPHFRPKSMRAWWRGRGR